LHGVVELLVGGALRLAIAGGERDGAKRQREGDAKRLVVAHVRPLVAMTPGFMRTIVAPHALGHRRSAARSHVVSALGWCRMNPTAESDSARGLRGVLRQRPARR